MVAVYHDIDVFVGLFCFLGEWEVIVLTRNEDKSMNYKGIFIITHSAPPGGGNRGVCLHPGHAGALGYGSDAVWLRSDELPLLAGLSRWYHHRVTAGVCVCVCVCWYICVCVLVFFMVFVLFLNSIYVCACVRICAPLVSLTCRHQHNLATVCSIFAYLFSKEKRL